MEDKIISKFISRQKELLDLELLADTSGEKIDTRKKEDDNDEEDERPRNSLGQLQILDVSVGLYGRTVVTLILNNDDGNSSLHLPSHRLTTGDEVSLVATSSSHNNNKMKCDGVDGVITKITDESISMAMGSSGSNGKNKSNTKDNNLDRSMDVLNQPPPFSLLSKGNIAIHHKIKKALDELSKYGLNHPIASKVLQEIFTCYSQKLSNDFSLVANTSIDTDKKHGKLLKNQQSKMNESQIEAIQFSLNSSNPLSLIHGPPGTGKTTTLVELIFNFLALNPKSKILVSAPSNIAVDTILMKCSEYNDNRSLVKKKKANKTPSISMVRIGHPARIHPHTIRHSLEHLVHTSHENEILKDIEDELNSHLQTLSNFQNYQNKKKELREEHQKSNNGRGRMKKISQKDKVSYSQKKDAKKEIWLLRKEIKQRHQKLVKNILSNNARIVFATNVGCANLSKMIMPNSNGNSNNNNNSESLSISSAAFEGFDLCIVDEAAQALPCASLIPILLSKKVVLAGDDCQLPPTVMSKKAQRKKLDETFFDMIPEKTGKRKLLNTQYRMNHIISDWASQNMYDGKLISASSVKDHTLGDIISTNNNESEDEDVADIVMLLIDTAGCECYEQMQVQTQTQAQDKKDDEDNNNNKKRNLTGSRYNKGECEIVQKHLDHLINDKQIKPEEIAIISPYNAQVELLKSKLLFSDDEQRDSSKEKKNKGLEIKSVDGFQGGEREVVILSLVRSQEDNNSNTKGAGVGFLRDSRRINVAVTRAKRHVCIVCDSDTVSQDHFIKKLIEWVEEYGHVRSAMEYSDDMN